MSKRKKQVEEELPKHHEVLAVVKSKRLPDYRPRPIYASVEEAKVILRTRYEKLKFKVHKVTRYDKAFFSVLFEPGKGPSNLESVLCNWPYINDLPDIVAVEKFLRKDVDSILKENSGRTKRA